MVNFLKLFFFWEERERGKGKGLGSAFRSQEGEDKGRTGYLYFPEKFTHFFPREAKIKKGEKSPQTTGY